MLAAGETSAARLPVYFYLAESSGLSREQAAAGSRSGQRCLAEQEILQLQQGEAPPRNYEQALGCREGKVLPGRRGEKAGLAPTMSHRAPRLLGKVGQTHRAPRRDGGCTHKQDLCSI